MADLNDDIKKYLNGELTPAEMHALEKRALNDPFLEDALEGAGQIGSEAFHSDLLNLKASLDDRISEKSGKVVSLWGWTMRIAAGLAIVAISTFVIIQLSGNKNNDDLALQKESPSPKQEEAVTSDSASLSRDDAAGAGVESAKPQTSPVTERPKARKEGELAQASKPKVEVGPSASSVAADQAPAEIANAEEQLSEATTGVVTDSTVVARQDAEDDHAASKRKEAEKTFRSRTEDADKRVAASQPALSTSKGYVGGVAGSKVITGRVVSVDGIGLPGVNVMLKNSNIGTVTDGSGNYKITTNEENPDLVYSFIGFTSVEVAAGDKKQVDVQLDEDVSQLSEVVVVGFGSEKTDETMETVELANPAGGRRAFKQYLEKNLQYPEQALAAGVEGKVTIQFTVESTGLLSDFKVIKGIGHGCEDEVIRLVKQGPKWSPTRKNTESLRDRVKVRMKFTLPKK